MISRFLLIRRLFSTKRKAAFNLEESFKYLTKSKKYETLSTIPTSLSYQKNQIRRSYDSWCFDEPKLDLDLASRLALCDELRYEIFRLADPNAAAEEEDNEENGETKKLNEFKGYSPDSLEYKHFMKFKSFLKLFLRSNLQQAIESPYCRSKFLDSLSPKLYLKILFYYGKFHFREQLTNNEIAFLESYPSSIASLQYDYDMYELTILSHCFFKLNLKMGRPFIERYLSTFYSLNQSDQLTFVYTVIKMVQQQDYFDKRFLVMIKMMLRDSHHLLPFNAPVLVAATLASLGHYDQELLELIARIVSEPTNLSNLRFKDLTKIAWAFSFLGYDLKNNPKLLNPLVDRLKMLNNRGYKLRYEGGTKDSIDMIKSLIYLNVYDFDLINLLLNDPSINALVRTNRSKVRNDLYFILRSLDIEHPNFAIINRLLYQIAKRPAQNLQRELQVRTDYPNFIEFYRRSLPSVDEYQHRIVYPLMHMNLTSVQVDYVEAGRKTSVLLDLLDRSNTLLGEPDRIKGVYKTKLRQMTAMGLDFVLFRKLDDRNYVKVDYHCD